MNKAFVKDDDSWEDPEIKLDPHDGIPQGARNYMTPEGAGKLRQELDGLLNDQRPEIIQALNNFGGRADSGNSRVSGDLKKQLRRINRRIEYLSGRLELTEVVAPGTQSRDKALFGAHVRVGWDDGREALFQIVGIDEADAVRGKIAWTSPMAKALLGKREGELAVWRSPSGKQEAEILEINYEKITDPQA